MRIIISPAKKMRDDDTLPPLTSPQYLYEAQQILDRMLSCSAADRQAIWNCNDAIALINEDRLKRMDLNRQLTPAILAYDGIQYQYMAPSVFESNMLSWLQDHLRILSGFYGVLRPLDGVTPYRLEMQAKLRIGENTNLYRFWNSKIYQAVQTPDRTILNLASAEYSKAVKSFLQPTDKFITCVFGEIEKGKIVQKGVYAKMARGEMVRYLAQIQADRPILAQGFNRLCYSFHPELSSDTEYVFLRKPKAVPLHNTSE